MIGQISDWLESPVARKLQRRAGRKWLRWPPPPPPSPVLLCLATLPCCFAGRPSWLRHGQLPLLWSQLLEA